MNKGIAEVKATEGMMKRCVLLGMCRDRWIHAAHLASLFIQLDYPAQLKSGCRYYRFILSLNCGKVKC